MTELAEMPTQKLGVLDIGSNSVRFVIYEVAGCAFTPVYNEKILAGLGRDLRQTGRLNAKGCELALAAILRFTLISRAQKLSKIIVGATAALREAVDAKAFINQVQDKTGLDISPVSGPQEAYLTAQGLISTMPRANGIAADLGGASLELIRVEDKHVNPGQTFPLGPFKVIGQAISKHDDFDIAEITSRVNAVLDQSDLTTYKNLPLYLIGGAWRNLAKIHQDKIDYPLKTLQAYEIATQDFQAHARWAYGEGRTDILGWKGISLRRAETLPYGALLLDVLIKRLSPASITISTTGLREGLIYDSLPETIKSRNALIDGCRDFAHGNLQSQNFAMPVFEFLSGIAGKLPSCFEVENETRLRRAACHLVGIGKGLNEEYQAGLVFDDVFYAPLADLTHKERAYLSLILFSSFTKSPVTPNDAAIHALLNVKERNAARCFGAAIRLAVVASARSNMLLGAFDLSVKKERLLLSVRPDYQDLITQRVILRLRKLAELMELEYETAVSEA